jgi:hypothetical protein
LELLAGGSFISLASLKLGMLSVHGLSREVFPDLNGNTKSARLAVTYVGWHTNTYTGVSVHAFEHPFKFGVYPKSIYLCKKVIP